MKTKIVFVAAALAAGWCAGADDCALRRKYIGHGWDLLAVTPEEVLAHADEFDRTGLDGVALMPRVTASDGRVGPRLVGILLGRGLNIDEAREELKGVTLESLVVAVRVARAVKKHIAAGKLDPADFPLLLHTDEILTEKKPVNIPWESFTFERT